MLRSYGPRYRIGRLLAVTPRVSVAEAIELAAAGSAPYVRVVGRIDSEAEFEGPAHEPLVVRLTRFQVRGDGGWRTYDQRREVVPFTVGEGLSTIAVDGERLDAGLVVVPRGGIVTAAEVAGRAPAGPPATPVRILVEQVTGIEHATVLGVPVSDATGTRMTAGRGRPLVLATLEPAEAMRVLASEAPARTWLASALIATGALLIALAGAWWLLLDLPGVAAAASPDPTRPPGNDPRSAGEGPGLVGEPLLAVLTVLAVAVVSIGLTSLYLRLTSRPGHGRR